MKQLNLVTLTLFLVCATLFITRSEGLNNGLGLLPPMGWTTWCTDNFLCIDDYCSQHEIESVALAISQNGMKELGYTYINLDDCWAGERTANGTITADIKRFPSGTLQPLAEYVHSLGLKLGLYTDAGTTTCKFGRPGSWPHYQQDANTYAEWEIDFVKMDWCDAPGGYTAQELYTNMSMALNATGRPMFFNLCEWGLYEPWTWAAPVGNSWRTGPDHDPMWWTPDVLGEQDPGVGHGTANIINHQAGLSSYAAPGGWNDPDFLMVGKATDGLTEENMQRDWQTEFSFWSLFNAPLIIAADPRNMSSIMSNVVMNSEVIAINQDPLAIAGDRRVQMSNGIEIWSKPLDSPNTWALIVYNSIIDNFKDPITVTVQWNNTTLPGWPSSATSATVRDLWLHEDLGILSNYTTTLHPHASSTLKVTANTY